MSDLTVEFKHDSWCVYRWSVYPRSSVLAGQDRHELIDSGFATPEEAQAKYPQARQSDAFVAPSVPMFPPADFDPDYAGERWEEDY